MRRRPSDPTRRLRIAIGSLPRHTKEAMIRGLDTNRIIVGAYVDPRSGGICPMLAAHRSGGRTDVASFARAWDEYTNARRPRRATRREVRTLRNLLAQSLELDTTIEHASIAQLAAQIRAEREAFRCANRGETQPTAADTLAAAESVPPTSAVAASAEPSSDRPSTPGEPEPLIPEPADTPIRVRRSPQVERRRVRDVRVRSNWRRPGERGELKDLLAAAEEQLAEAPAAEPVGD